MTVLFICSGKRFLQTTTMKWQTWSVALRGCGHGGQLAPWETQDVAESAAPGSALYASHLPEKLPPFLAHTALLVKRRYRVHSHHYNRLNFIPFYGWAKKKGYINTYICNLERWYWWTYSQGKNRDLNVENGLADTAWDKQRAALTFVLYYV